MFDNTHTAPVSDDEDDERVGKRPTKVNILQGNL